MRLDEPTEQDEAESALELVVELSRALHSVTVPSDAIEELMAGVSLRIGASSQLLVLQSAVIAQLRIADRERIAILRMPFVTHWGLQRMQQVVAIARDVADGTLGVAPARAQLARVLAERDPHRRLAVMLGYAVYSAAVAARIGGRWLEMLAAAIVGVVAGAIHVGAQRTNTINLQQSLLAGFFGTLCVLALALVLPGLGLAPALFGGMALLVPATVITIGVHELASGAVEAGVPRTCYGLLRFAMIAAGISAAGRLWKLLAPIATPGAPHALPMGIVLAILVVGGLALIVCLQMRWHDVPWVVGGVLLAFGVQELTTRVIPDQGAPMASAFVLGSVAYLQARVTGRLPAIIVVPGLLQLTPGFLGTKAVLAVLTGTSGGNATFFEVTLVALQLSIGILFASVLFRPRGGAPQQAPGAQRTRERTHARA